MFKQLTTAAGYHVWVNLEQIIRCWVEPETIKDSDDKDVENPRRGETAIMYAGGVTDHVVESLEAVMKGVKKKC